MKMAILNAWRLSVAKRKTCAYRRDTSIRTRPGVVIATTIGAMLLLGGIGTDALGAGRAPALVPAGFVAAPPAPEIKACLPFLKVASQQNVSSPATHKNPGAGVSPDIRKAAMVALVLGVQNVVGPAEIGQQRQKVNLSRSKTVHSGQDTGHAIAVAAYRRCVSQKTLEARNATLNGWRWTR